MKWNRVFIEAMLFALVLNATLAAAQNLSNDEWQSQIKQYTEQRNALHAKLTSLDKQIADLRIQSAKLDGDYRKCLEELYALVGSNEQMADAYRKEIQNDERKADEFLKLADADLAMKKNDVEELKADVARLWMNKLSIIPEFWDSLKSLDQKIAQLESALNHKMNVYTVGTWSRDRDCLWNISKKKTIYDNAWLWPKIWQENREQIKDPDILHPGQKLRIPPKAALTTSEKAAEHSYYRRKG